MRTDFPIGTHPEGVMSFAEIGKRLGITRARAWQIYVTAIKKLSRNPQLSTLRAQAADRQAERRERVYPEWV